MLVKVNDNFTGTYGQYDEITKVVSAKKAGDAPFVVSDAEARRLVSKGVLVCVDDSDAPVLKPEAPEAEEPAPTADAPVLEAETADTEAAEPEPTEEDEEKPKAAPKRRKKK